MVFVGLQEALTGPQQEFFAGLTSNRNGLGNFKKSITQETWREKFKNRWY